VRQFHVKVFFHHIRGSGRVTGHESLVTFVNSFEVDGIYIASDWAELTFAPFGELWLALPTPGERSPDLVDPYVRFYEALTPADCLEGSSFNFAPGVMRSAVRGLPVSTFEFIEGTGYAQALVA
jgi:hypothetical protein